MNSEMIELIEKKRNNLRNIIFSKGILATKIEKEILEKYENLLIEQYSKFIDY